MCSWETSDLIIQDYPTTTNYGKLQTLWLVANNTLDGSDLGIYNTHGKLKSKQALDDLTNFFNEFLKNIIGSLNNKNSDW